ncbi:hypothetical protein cypCar_00039977, partial [Cyprinus carpio]
LGPAGHLHLLAGLHGPRHLPAARPGEGVSLQARGSPVGAGADGGKGARAVHRRRVERELRQLEQGKLNKAPLWGPLLQTYLAHVVTHSVVEMGFMTGQCLLYGPKLQRLYKCEREPCPNVVDCFVSRPTEKSVFIVFMKGIAANLLLLSLLEIKKLRKGLLDYCPPLRDDECGAKRNSLLHQGHISPRPDSSQQICSAPGEAEQWTHLPCVC